MSEVNDGQLARLPQLIASGSGSLGAGTNSVVFQAATTLKWIVAVRLTTAATAYVAEEANVVANAGLSYRIEHFADDTQGVRFTNNAAVTLSFTFSIYGWA